MRGMADTWWVALGGAEKKPPTTWSIEDETVARALRREAARHRLTNPFHRFGAIHTAQLEPWKRHELSLGIPRCAFLFYRGISSTRGSEAALIARHASAAPGHCFVNAFDGEGTPVRLPPNEVNRYFNRAAVGLALSVEEGAMSACAECLLAGLPVVTTPNRGGRDFHVDGETCIEVAADPRQITAAVDAVKAKAIPRRAIRDRTLTRIHAERTRFVDLVNAIYSESGVRRASSCRRRSISPGRKSCGRVRLPEKGSDRQSAGRSHRP